MKKRTMDSQELPGDRSLHSEKGADRQGANEEYDGLKAQKASIPAELILLVKSTPGIQACKIYNRDDFVLAKSSKHGSDLTIALSGYFESVSILENAMASGRLTYFLVNVRDGGRFLFFEFEQLRLILLVKPEFNITEFSATCEQGSVSSEEIGGGMQQALNEMNLIRGVMGGYVYNTKMGVIEKNLPPVFKEEKLREISSHLIKLNQLFGADFPDHTDAFLFF